VQRHTNNNEFKDSEKYREKFGSKISSESQEYEARIEIAGMKFLSLGRYTRKSKIKNVNGDKGKLDTNLNSECSSLRKYYVLRKEDRRNQEKMLTYNTQR
jgi:hypothetical protein